jgi:SHAQKYF class myb-like DNA-binding protein
MSLQITTLATETSLSQSQDAERMNGRWTKEEHNRFVEAIRAHGKNWKKVEEAVGTRSGAQIRSHAQKHFLKLEKEVKTSPKTKQQKKSSKKTAEVSLSTSDNISESGKSDVGLKGNLPMADIYDNITEASDNIVAVQIIAENVEVSNVASKSNNMEVENSADYSQLSKAQLLSKLQACEEKVDFFHQFVTAFTAAQTTDTTTVNPFLGKAYHHLVYLDLMSYFGVFNKATKSLKVSDFVDLSCKTQVSSERSFEVPASKKKVKIL